MQGLKSRCQQIKHHNKLAKFRKMNRLISFSLAIINAFDNPIARVMMKVIVHQTS